MPITTKQRKELQAIRAEEKAEAQEQAEALAKAQAAMPITAKRRKELQAIKTETQAAVDRRLSRSLAKKSKKALTKVQQNIDTRDEHDRKKYADETIGGTAPPPPVRRDTARIWTILEEEGFDPIRFLVWAAKGDTVKMGLMTQAEYDKVRVETKIRGMDPIVQPSGRDRALEMLPPLLRCRMAQDLALYTYAKRAPVVITSEGNEAAQPILVYLPSNGRQGEDSDVLDG